jgi:hypothetical protein
MLHHLQIYETLTNEMKMQDMMLHVTGILEMKGAAASSSRRSKYRFVEVFLMSHRPGDLPLIRNQFFRLLI